MFIIIGGDGKEYGPVTVEQIRAWITAGRANLETKAKAVGTDEWRRLGDFAEFSDEAVPPPLGAPTIPSVPTSTNDAERWRRFLGALIDGFLETLCWTPTSIALMSTIMEMVNGGRVEPTELVSAFWGAIGRSLPYLAALVLLQGTLLTLRSQSLGKIALGIRIVRKSDGTPGGFVFAFLVRGVVTRVLRQIPFLGGIFWLVDICFIFGEERRCLHDLIAGTKVVKV